MRPRVTIPGKAWVAAAILAALAWAIVVLVLFFWKWIVLLVTGGIAWRYLRRQIFPKRRKSSTFARNVAALSAAYASWNSRWLKPSRFKATVRENTEGTITTPAGVKVAPYDWKHDDIPY